MRSELGALFQHRELLWMWTWRGVRARYKQTMLGGAWAIIQPLSLMVVFSIVFTRFIHVDTDGIPYPVFSYTALLPWTLFAAALTSGIPSLVDNMQLVTKIYFPREIFPLAAIGARLVDFIIAIAILLGLMTYYHIPMHWTWLWVPFLFGVQLALMVGICLLGSAVDVFYRDVQQVMVLLLSLWMYATPVIYPIDMVPAQLRAVYGLNPMVGLIESYRATILRGQAPPPDLLGVSMVISLGLLCVGYWYFKRVEGQFGDII